MNISIVIVNTCLVHKNVFTFSAVVGHWVSMISFKMMLIVTAWYMNIFTKTAVMRMTSRMRLQVMFYFSICCKCLHGLTNDVSDLYQF